MRLCDGAADADALELVGLLLDEDVDCHRVGEVLLGVDLAIGVGDAGFLEVAGGCLVIVEAVEVIAETCEDGNDEPVAVGFELAVEAGFDFLDGGIGAGEEAG